MPTDSTASTRPLAAAGRPNWPLRGVAALAFVAGAMDIYIYSGTMPVFVANQSGNLILVGAAVGRGDVASALAHLASLAAYMVGAGVAWVVLRRARARGMAIIFSVEVLALLATWALQTARLNVVPSLPAVAVVTVCAFGMGTQGALARRSAGMSVLTTGSTGDVTDTGEAAAAVLAERTGASKSWLGVLGAVITCYTLGAAAATVGFRWLNGGPWVAFLPIAVLVAVATVGGFRPQTAEPSALDRPNDV